MPDFYVTFGSQYPGVPHPTWGAAHRDGWLRITGARDELEARDAMSQRFGTRWSNIYPDEPGAEHFPLGEIGRMSVTGGRIEDARDYLDRPARKLAALLVHERLLSGHAPGAETDAEFLAYEKVFSDYLTVDPDYQRFRAAQRARRS